ncbi:hypothetical protein HNR23_000969 [Nocardiopsis mwathae]|uniref:Uncharacterized protein n=1 Tax=Nocardiopsis mwathae TaxID=1472723 RepID=A0A7W9YF37_9ACTN|nr:hypothetical protein [Nocardiopsis mwathae]MBB6170909.1 hypothetical protein [Nocardiopsis mwathae]
MRSFPVIAAALLIAATALPAAATSGNLTWTFDQEKWHVHADPASGCYTIAGQNSAATVLFRNESRRGVILHEDTRCHGPSDFLAPKRESRFPARSYGVL